MLKSKKNTVNIAEAKAKLSKYLQLAKNGQETTILEYRTPIAKLVPIHVPEMDDIFFIQPDEPIATIHKLSKEKGMSLPFDSASILIEDRE